MDRENFKRYEPEPEPRPAARPVAHVPHELPDAKPPAVEEPPVKKPRLRNSGPSKNRRKPLMIAGIVLLLAALVAGAFYLGRQGSPQPAPKSSPTQSAQQEKQQLIAEVGKLTPLPNDETPTVATVNDAAKLKDQSFFVNAKDGDKVLIYNKAGKAYLYRPSTNQIINVAPISGNSSPTGTSTD